jgi:hypothetical protein
MFGGATPAIHGLVPTGITIVLTPRGEHGGPSRVIRRIAVAGNLFARMGDEALLKISGGDRIRFDHNTSRQRGSVVIAYGVFGDSMAAIGRCTRGETGSRTGWR